MKKRISILFCCLLSLCITGCGKEEIQEEEKVEKETTEVEKINLNDNVYYYSDIQLTDKDCGGFGFPTNAEEKIEESWFSTYVGLKSVDRIELYMHEDIEYDSETEKKVKEEWDKLEKPSRGVTDFSIGYTTHEFYFGYWYITLVKDSDGTEFSQGDKYYEINQSIHEEIETFKNKAYTLIKENGGSRLNGTCGGPAYDVELLDESACDKYNLTCDRW